LPTANSTVSNIITLSVTASDNISTPSVQFKLDGTNIGDKLIAVPYTTTWDTTQSTNGKHVLTAVASDVAGNISTSSSVTVIVSNTSPQKASSGGGSSNPTISVPQPATQKESTFKATQVVAEEISNYSTDVVTREKLVSTVVDKKIINRLKGQILLQVQSRGEAWYVNPKDSKRYYLANGEAAFQMLRKFGLGITNADLNKISLDTATNKISSALANRLKGQILLQVQSRGEAWYVNPKDSKRYYLANGEAAFQIMRFLSLGITNINLRKINVGEIK
jgi:hypothetical protein